MMPVDKNLKRLAVDYAGLGTNEWQSGNSGSTTGSRGQYHVSVSATGDGRNE
jgi:hypothetical protein